MSSSAKADDPVRRGLSASSQHLRILDARFAGMTKLLRSSCSLSLSFAAHEIEIAAFVGLQNGLVEQMRVTALGPIGRYSRRQCGAAFFELRIVDQEIDAALGDVEPDHVAVLYQRQRATDGGFRGDMQHNGAERGAAHARVRYPHHVLDAGTQ